MWYTVPPNSKMFPIGGESVTCHWSKLIKSLDASGNLLFCKCALFFLQKFQAVQNFRGAFLMPIN